MTSENKIRAVTALVGVVGLLFGIYKFISIQEIDAAQPYLKKKLEWCEEAVETASTIANHQRDEVPEYSERRFWELYWGVMGLVEKQVVTKAMIAYGEALQSGVDLKRKSLELAHACREELADDWSSSWTR